MGRRGNGEGSIWQRADGRWSGSYFVPTPSGGQARRYVYGTSREAVRDKLASLMAQVERGLPVASTQGTLGAYLEAWLTDVAAKRVRQNTMTSYRINVRLHIVPKLGKKKLGKLTAADVRTMIDQCKKQGLSDRSVRYVHATLRAALEDAVREDLVPRNVAKLVRLSTPERKETRVLSATEARHLLASTKDERLRAALVLLLHLGLRRSELLGLRWTDVDFDARTLSVRQGLHWLDGSLQFLPPKTRRSRRTIPLPGTCVTALKGHRARMDREREVSLVPWPPVELVFVSEVGTPIDPNNFSRLFARWCRDADLPAVRLHDLRHTCVSLLLSLGIGPRVVMEIVGHAALEMTMNVYGHVALDDQREALDRLDEEFTEEVGE